MSHAALRRVMIRMLHDRVFAAAVYADPERALAGVEISGEERGWLTRPPAVAWRTDPSRPARVMAALAEEFPVTLALAGGLADGFFASVDFHHAVQNRGSLALALGDYLARAASARVRSIARLETTIARVRRAPRAPRPSPPGELRLTPRAAVVRVPAGTLALLEARRRGGRGGSIGPAEETLLVVRAPDTGEVSIEELPAALATLLETAATAVPHEALLAVAARHGADPGEEAAIVEGLVRDALLV